MKIASLFIEGTPLLAHIGRSQDETVTEHSELVMTFCKKLMQENGLGEAVSRTIAALTYQGDPLSIEEQAQIENWFYQAIYLHDLGKVNPAFQSVKMKNKKVIRDEALNHTHHSLLSSLLYLELYEQDLPTGEEDEEKCMFFAFILYIFSYIISRHHSYLEDLSLQTYGEKLQNLSGRIDRTPLYLAYYVQKSRYFDVFRLEEFTDDSSLNYDSHNPYPLYILTRLLYSALVASDFYATYTYDRDGVAPSFRYLSQADKAVLRQTYNQSQVVQGIEAYKVNPHHFDHVPINQVRSDMYLEAEQQLMEHDQQSLFYLEAPTGGGKTNLSLNLALSLLEKEEQLNKILYIFPFNTLVEQTKKVFDEIFPPEIQKHYPIAVINSVTPIHHDYEKEDIEYVDASVPTKKAFYDDKEAVLYRQMMQYPMTLTSHVNFFNYLFGTGREANLALVHLCNSVIILDEIQSYKNDRWMEIIAFLERFSELLNFKVIIMSATLPRLDQLLEQQRATVELLPNASRYFQHPLFKKRVQLHYELLDEGRITAERLVAFMDELRERYGRKRVLLECIKKKDAREVYRLLLDRYANVPVVLLTGQNHAYYRKRVLDQLGKNEEGTFKMEEVIVVATQVIEAGVDIDMDIGLKDISTLDSEEQLLGRINRSCLRTDCHAFFFHMSDAKEVYRNDFRLAHDLREEEIRLKLENKQFASFYQTIFAEQAREKKYQIQQFQQVIQALQYTTIGEHMKLIQDRKYRLFLAHTIETEAGTLHGEEVWAKFKALNDPRQKREYANRRMALSRVMEEMSYFIFSVYERPSVYDGDPIGDIYYIEEGERYLQVDPFTGLMIFDEEKYKAVDEELFL
ncbi:CRISPR-associated helicase Cas3' [Hazenella sp. IB182353]|uniref:CRISPR-associated helicase Cas3' n=1 Tax=Polycladospora coralii TaxID=2771432 RepID=UPI0017464FB0|nr:CRISPR-associated helicase Cas3' [Polycladospora coralii]MBS7530266.1 CRISPR-associated helicase Cas3' [Polycladospora coralii]